TTILQNGLTSTATPGITVGSQAGSNGTLSVENGATWTINRSSAGCCMTVGLSGHGNLNITGGGKFIVNDSSAAGGAAILFGGKNTVASGGTFNAVISGAGSTLTVDGIDSNITVGRVAGSSGTMTVTAGATLNADTLSMGRGGTAALNVSGDGTTVNLVADASGTLGAGLSVGSLGNGSMTISGGAAVNVDATSPGTGPSGATIGGSRVLGGGGTGNLTISGTGSRISMVGSAAQLLVGFDPTAGSTPSTGAVIIGSGGRVTL